MFESFANFFIKGGPFMVPLVLCSVLSVAIMLERGYALRRSMIINPELANAILELRYGESFKEIEQLAADQQTTLARLVHLCLKHLAWPKAENIEALQTKARTEIAWMEQGIVILEIAVGIGPLLGLLGTVSGLVTIFSHISDATLASQGAYIARGISEALHSTIAGLVVAIPSLIAFSIYSRRIEDFAVELESLSIDLIVKLYAAHSVAVSASTTPL